MSEERCYRATRVELELRAGLGMGGCRVAGCAEDEKVIGIVQKDQNVVFVSSLFRIGETQ